MEIMQIIENLNLGIFLGIFVMPFAVTAAVEYRIEKYEKIRETSRHAENRKNSWNSIKTAMSEMN